MWIYGFHPVREALRSDPASAVRVLLGRGRSDERAGEIRALCESATVPVETVDEEEIARRVDGVHNGIALETADRRVRAGKATDLVVLAEDVQDPRNLGALIRVCDAAGVDQLLVRDRGSAPVGSTARKTSAGAAAWLPVERVTNSGHEIARLKKEGFWVYGAAAGGLSPWEVDLTGPVALCVGGEEKGLRKRTRDLCDELIGLPMMGRVASLNLSTAAAAVLYEIVRQRS